MAEKKAAGFFGPLKPRLIVVVVFPNELVKQHSFANIFSRQNMLQHFFTNIFTTSHGFHQPFRFRFAASPPRQGLRQGPRFWRPEGSQGPGARRGLGPGGAWGPLEQRRQHVAWCSVKTARCCVIKRGRKNGKNCRFL